MLVTVASSVEECLTIYSGEIINVINVINVPRKRRGLSTDACGILDTIGRKNGSILGHS